MGVFSRMRDIVNANLNSMLEKAEDPEKLIKLMIMEMEDTLVEIKASAAGVMASRKKSQRELAAYQKKSQDWGDKAALALSKDREDLAREAHWPPNYTADDLYRPKVSVNLGTAYLDSQRRYFEGDVYAALAAYNAGYGNALTWLESSNGDQDLFVETIRFQETQRYIKGIKEIFAIYRRLYGRKQ